MARLTKNVLTTPHFAQEEVEVAGGTVLVRALSRADLLQVDQQESTATTEQKMVASAMIDPVMTPDEVAAWQASSGAGEISAVVAVINRLAGLERGAGKDAYKSV